MRKPDKKDEFGISCCVAGGPCDLKKCEHLRSRPIYKTRGNPRWFPRRGWGNVCNEPQNIEVCVGHEEYCGCDKERWRLDEIKNQLRKKEREERERQNAINARKQALDEIHNSKNRQQLIDIAARHKDPDFRYEALLRLEKLRK